MIVVLIGAPGAGKGTQADKLVEKNGYRKLSTGDALRKHVRLETAIGKAAAEIMKKGQLVPDEVLYEILATELQSEQGKVVLLDGFPRNVAQAEFLKSLDSVNPVKVAVHIDVPTEELVKRLCGRRVCGGCSASFHVVNHPPKVEGKCDKCGGSLVQRPDDAADAISMRLNVYEQATRPVLDFYRDSGLYRRLDGMGSSEIISSNLKALIDSAARLV